MLSLQIKSTVSGIWDVDSIPIGWRATGEDYDGAEDALDDSVVWGKTLDDLFSEIRDWDNEHFVVEEESSRVGEGRK